MIVIGLSIYLIAMMVIGLVAGSRVKDLDDYLVAGRKLPYFLVVPTIVATWFGAGTCMGVSGIAYTGGLKETIADPFGCSVALLLAALFFVKQLRKRNFVTISDMMRVAYGKKAETFASFLMIPFYVGTLASQLVAIGYIFALFTGMDTFTGIFLGALAVVIYTTAGGMWAVTVTDLVQFVFLVGSVVMLLVYSLGSVPDFFVLASTVKSDLSNILPHHLNCSGWCSYLGRWLMTGLGGIMGQDLIQRALAAKSENVAKAGTLTAAVLYLVLGMIPIIIGVAGRLSMPDLQEPELLIPIMAQKVFTPFLFTIFVIGLLSAIMSTADSYLLAGTSILVHNVIVPLSRDDRHALLYMRTVNIILVVLALFIGMALPRIFDLMVHSGATLFVAIFVPITAALHLRHPTATAAWSSMITGLIFWLGAIIYRVNDLSTSHEEALYFAAMIGGSASLVGYAVPYIYQRYVRAHTLAPS